MTRMEYMQHSETQQLAGALCNIVTSVNDRNGIEDVCKGCPASELCYVGHTGFTDWLMEDRDADSRAEDE